MLLIQTTTIFFVVLNIHISIDQYLKNLRDVLYMPTGTSSSTHGMSKEIYDKINDNQLKKYNIQDMIRFTRNL